MILIPFADFNKCAKCFDSRTLTRQCIAILRLLRHYYKNRFYDYHRSRHNLSQEEINSDASLWRNYQQILVEYGMVLAQERLNRGFNDAFLLHIAAFKTDIPSYRPKWLGWELLHQSHRSALLVISERQVIQNGIKIIKQSFKQSGISRFCISHEEYRSIDEWLECSFCTSSIRHLDKWDLDRIKHSLAREHNIRFPRNFYRIQGFEDRSDLPLAWPYQYVKEN